MTAAQTSISQKAMHPMSGPIAVVAASLIVAVVGVAIVARPLAAPASTVGVNPASVLTLGHDESRFSAPALTFGHDEHAASGFSVPVLTTTPAIQAQSYVQYLISMHAYDQLPTGPTVPLIPRGGGSDRGK